MNKAELAEEVSTETGLTKAASGRVVSSIIDAITDALAREERVTLVGFGTFRVMKRKARRGRNPRTGQTIQIPAKKVPRFKPGKGSGKVTARRPGRGKRG